MSYVSKSLAVFGPLPDDQAPIEAWLRAALTAQWNQALAEGLPPELAALLERFPDDAP